MRGLEVAIMKVLAAFCEGKRSAAETALSLADLGASGVHVSAFYAAMDMEPEAREALAHGYRAEASRLAQASAQAPA